MSLNHLLYITPLKDNPRITDRITSCKNVAKNVEKKSYRNGMKNCGLNDSNEISGKRHLLYINGGKHGTDVYINTSCSCNDDTRSVKIL